MKIVTCFTPGQLKDETVQALATYGKDVHLILLKPGDETAYGRQIAKLWRQEESFAIVEPDIVIRGDVVDAFENCTCEYGAFPYPWKTNVGPALGCTWFRDSFITKYPSAVEQAGPRSISWRQFDVVFMRHVLVRKYGEQPHVHLPPVVHLNEAKQLLPDADPTPMLEVPEW